MLQRYKPEADGGMLKTVGDGGIARVVKSKTAERDGWNTVEVIVRGSESVEHIVNGQTIFRAKNLQELSTPASAKTLSKEEVEQQKWVPLTTGRIALQCEFAEVFYRGMEIKEIGRGKLGAE
jgi:hypothetical protein